MEEPIYLELGAPSSAKAREFYAGLFGWKFHDHKSDCWAEMPGGRAGFHSGDEDRCFIVYFAVKDIDVAAKRVRDLGGSAPEPSAHVDGFGRFVECKDPQGVRFGLRQV
jgi:uncharacterized protein